MSASSSPALLETHRKAPDVLELVLAGDWVSGPSLPGFDQVAPALAVTPPPRRVAFETSRLGRWNSGLLVLVAQCAEWCEQNQVQLDLDHLPPGARNLLQLARAVPEKKDARRESAQAGWVERLGMTVIRTGEGARNALAFLGEVLIAAGRGVRGRAQFRWPDALLVMQQCGPQALGVVALINFLVGLILAFVGSVQLSQFGAGYYVADLVAIGTVREMGCLMTGIILCGRTGAAFAAQLGTMKVNEELDAFQTFGISPAEFLVLPRVLALLFMMPLLCVFADLISILGGFTVSTFMLNMTATEYIDRTLASITLTNFLLGIVKGGCFGAIIAFTGCLRGVQCGNNAAAVGEATTSAAVTGITSIIAADGLFAVLCDALNI